MGLLAFVVVYVLGGLTLLPLLICAVLLHAHLTFPTKTESTSISDSIQDSSDDGNNIKSTAALADLAESFQRGHEPDVAAGYFAVCREYVPGGVNGKPPERTTPAGTTDVAPESLSVYQSMYRSIFDRKQGPTLDPGKDNGKPAKKARNVFFVVLRHGHLMLYDDSEQLDPRHVIFLEHHDVSIYGGEEEIPEGELFIKRNSIRLTRKAEIMDSFSTSKPFYFFSENCSDKEDFYFALLHNQEAKSDAADSPPRPQQYDVKHIITLVQKLHSSEEQLQTRWINGLIGRLFLALYKTNEVEDFLRSKITKKIARVKKPAFLSRIVLRKIDMGEGAPYITNPRLKDLTIDGDCCVEADFKYGGNFRLEIAATARIDLGTRFKAREVDLVLAVVVKKLEGHALLKFKPPPSNRIWISFETMPFIDMSIEPIVSSRQITYNIILRAIENRIREVIAETIVLPHWDDSPFTDTSNESYRGGIWARSRRDEASKHTDIPDEIAEDEVEANTITLTPAPPSPRLKEERTMSLPILATSVVSDHSTVKAGESAHTLHDGPNTAVSTGVRKRLPEPPKAMRARSFANAADPLVNLDNANVAKEGKGEIDKRDMKYPDATSTMMAINQRSPPMSPTETPVGSSREQPTLWETSISRSGSNRISPASSKPGSIVERTATPASLDGTFQATTAPSTTSTSSSSRYSNTNLGHKHNDSTSSIEADSRASTSSTEKKYSTASLGAATAAAKKWGWNVISRNTDSKSHHGSSSTLNRAGTPEHPIGRGQPLPPLGQPLPFPERKSQFSLPKRKPIPPQNSQSTDLHKSKNEDPPVLPQRKQDETELNGKTTPTSPRRRRQEADNGGANDGDGILIVEAPVGSEPSSPLPDDRKSLVESSETDVECRSQSSSPKHSDGIMEEANDKHLNKIEKTFTATST